MTKSKLILLVEDDHATAEMLMTAFENTPYRLKWVDTAGEALQILTQCATGPRDGHCPDIVLLDLMLPDLYSGEMLMQLSRLPRSAPIIVISAKPHMFLVEAACLVNADAVLQKPFHLDDLWEQFRRLNMYC